MDMHRIEEVVRRLNMMRPVNWRITGFLQRDAGLMILSTDPRARVSILCSKTRFVRSYTHIRNPHIAIAVEERPQSMRGRSLSMMMDDGTTPNQVICEEICVVFPNMSIVIV